VRGRSGFYCKGEKRRTKLKKQISIISPMGIFKGLHTDIGTRFWSVRALGKVAGGGEIVTCLWRRD